MKVGMSLVVFLLNLVVFLLICLWLRVVLEAGTKIRQTNIIPTPIIHPFGGVIVDLW